jgi:hypothetical protein
LRSGDACGLDDLLEPRIVTQLGKGGLNLKLDRPRVALLHGLLKPIERPPTVADS